MNGMGIAGERIPYLLNGDEWITGILVLCFLMTSYVLSHGRSMLFQSVRTLFSNHGIDHIFHKQASVDNCCLILLNLQSCLLVSVLLLKYLINAPESDLSATFTSSTTLVFLEYYIGLTVLYLVVKRIGYKFINWVFFDKAKNSLWLESYFFVISIFGMLLLPVTLLIIYGDFPFYISVIIPVFLFFLMNLFFVYKCFSIFFNQLHGWFYLFLYFCTLEVLPFLVVWKGIAMVNDILL